MTISMEKLLKFVKFLFLLLLIATSVGCTHLLPPSPPPLPSGRPALGFCDLRGTDLLKQLDGRWSIQQGPGLAWGGIVPVPLPPHAPQSVTLSFNAEEGVADLRGADLADSMIMFPAAKQQQTQARDLLTTKDSPRTAESASHCPWSSLPILLGTNYYTVLDAKRIISSGLKKKWCKDNENTYPGGKNNTAWKFNCIEHMPVPSEFEMDMTLVVRFISENYGTGTLYFDGRSSSKGRRARFEAEAPVTLFR